MRRDDKFGLISLDYASDTVLWLMESGNLYNHIEITTSELSRDFTLTYNNYFGDVYVIALSATITEL